MGKHYKTIIKSLKYENYTSGSVQLSLNKIFEQFVFWEEEVCWEFPTRPCDLQCNASYYTYVSLQEKSLEWK